VNRDRNCIEHVPLRTQEVSKRAVGNDTSVAERRRRRHQRRVGRARPGPATGGDTAEHGDPQRDLDHDLGHTAANPAQNEPATGAGRNLGRSPARHRLAPHRLGGCGERGQVRGGLGAVAPADGRDQPEHRG
jgi:hypothetical protein